MPSPALSARWIQKRQPHWARLDALLHACGRGGVRALTHRELQELALLYRQAAADLSTARADPTSAALAQHLNQLLGRAHNHLYTGTPGGWRGVLHFYTRQFPRVFRDTWRYTATATAIFAAGAVIGVLLSTADPGFNRFVLGAQMIDTIERQEMWTHSILAMKPLASGRIMTNNLAVSFLACATGIFAGLGTFYMMALNGLMIGVVCIACQQAGLGLSLWSFIAPHGALELPALCIAGGAGLILAHGVLVPGLLSRRDAVANAGGRAMRLLLGVVPMLIVAGLIEGFISPTAVPAGVKFAIGGGLFVLLAFYLASGLASAPTRLTTHSAP
jgi:uncharacterized membrane protein SpoIIM required for sporulation